jgi:hypothetical protein
MKAGMVLAAGAMLFFFLTLAIPMRMLTEVMP